MFWVLLSVVLILVVMVVVDRCLRDHEFEKILGPKGYYFVGNALDFIMDLESLFYFFHGCHNKFKDLYKITLGTKKFIIIYRPEDVEIVMSGMKHSAKGFGYTFLKPWLKDGLLLSDGSKWQLRRKILTPAFHFNILRHFHSSLEENSRKLVEKLQSEVHQPQTDIMSVVSDFTLESICETAMGTKLDTETSRIGKSYKHGIYTLANLIVYRAQRVWLYVDAIFKQTVAGRQQKEILDLIASFRNNVVNKRRNIFQDLMLGAANDDNENNDDDIVYKGKKRLAMLDLLLKAEKEDVIDAEGIGEEVDTFMFEGHDTTAIALNFAFMLFANHPDAQEKVVKECEEIFGSSTRATTMKDLGQMKYLECCIKETMRLYPPVFFISRTIDQDVQIQNYNIPAGTDCTVYIYGLHRREDQYEKPLEFRPDRFLQPTWHPFGYIPFSAGLRNCIGQKFAMMEMKLALSSVLRRYRVLPVTKPQDVRFIMDFLLRTKEPVYVKFEHRF